MEAVKSFILAGDGIGVMPSIICENELKSGKIVQIFPGWSIDAGAGSRVTMSFVYPAHKFVPAKVKAFLDLACSSSVSEPI
jgi:DNA-binding transcriptional LysR family regulator